MLQGCNRFLKWVGLERGNKPILGGPTLAGLPGGVVGDLQRLYPIRSNFEYPVGSGSMTLDLVVVSMTPCRTTTMSYYLCTAVVQASAKKCFQVS